MLINDELSLLIKSKYPAIYLETADENYVINQLQRIAEELKLLYFSWSLTSGLKKGTHVGPYYKSENPVNMLKTLTYLIQSEETLPGIFILIDFQKYLNDVLVLRLFKDLITILKKTKNTVVIIASELNIPKDIESDIAHFIGGIPTEEEIEQIIHATFSDLAQQHKEIQLLVTDQEKKTIAAALKGLSTHQIRNIINRCILDDNMLHINDVPTIEKYKRKVFDQEGLLEFCAAATNQHLANFYNLKQWAACRKDIFSAGSASSLPAPRGVLLMGVQGCGKSLALKVIAKELSLPLYRLDVGRLYDKYIGQTEQNLRKALMTAEKLSPLCLWIDEIEKGFAASDGQGDGGVSQRLLGTFLTWMQEHHAKCFLGATANDVYRLPPEFLRKGRFDEIFFVDLPDSKTRQELFEIHLTKRSFDARSFDRALLAEKTEGFSGAEIEQTIISALYRASNKKLSLSLDHILEQINATKPLSVLKQEEISALREWAKDRTIHA